MAIKCIFYNNVTKDLFLSHEQTEYRVERLITQQLGPANIDVT